MSLKTFYQNIYFSLVGAKHYSTFIQTKKILECELRKKKKQIRKRFFLIKRNVDFILL